MNVLEKILEVIEKESKLAHEEMCRCAIENPLQFDEVKGYARGVEYAKEIIRSHMDKENEIMSNDLISRKALYEKFCISTNGNRLPEIDVDNFPVTISIKDVKQMIRERPTVYDVEKVIEQLEKCRDIMLSPVIEDCFGKKCKYNDCTACVFDKAIKILQKGGTEE